MLLKKQTVQIKLFYMEEYGTCQSKVKVEEKKKVHCHHVNEEIDKTYICTYCWSGPQESRKYCTN